MDSLGNTSGQIITDEAVRIAIFHTDAIGQTWENYLKNVLPGGTLTVSNGNNATAAVFNVTQTLGENVPPGSSNRYTFGVEWTSGATSVPDINVYGAKYTLTSPSSGPGTAGTSGTSAVAGSSGTVGTSGSSGTSDPSRS